MTAILTQTRFGPMLVPPYDVYLSQAMIRRGEYAPDEFETWAPYLFQESIVVDIGANFGAHTFAFADRCRFGAVFAIEPQRMLYNMLCGTVALNSRKYSHVRAKHCAIGRTPGQVTVPPIDYSGVGNFGGVELGGPDRIPGDSTFEWRKDGEPALRMPLDDLHLQRADFLKIDVEGMEPDVLAGAVQTIGRCRPVLSIEADREDNVPGIRAFLAEHKYRAWWHRPPLGDLWPNIVSINLLALPEEKELPEPEGDVEPVDGNDGARA